MNDVCKVRDALLNAQSLLITCHVNPDGDALGSALALSSVLRRYGKKTQVVCQDPVPHTYKFIKQTAEVRSLNEASAEYDTFVCVDMNELSRCGTVASFYNNEKQLCIIDHHEFNAVSGSAAAYIITEYGACAMAVMDVIKACNYSLNDDEAALLYTGLSTDTGHFAYSNTKKKTMEYAAELLEHIPEPQRIYEALYGHHSLAHVLLMRDILNNMQLSDGGAVAYSILSAQELKEADAKPGDTDGLINVLRSIEGVKACFIIREEKDGKKSVSMRTDETVDAQCVMSAVGGGGHKRAAGATVESDTYSLIELILQEIRKNWDKK